MRLESEGLSDQHRTSPIRRPIVEWRYEDDINLLDYWRVIWSWRWMIAGLCVATMFTATVMALMSPKIYVATVTMMLPSQSVGGDLSSLANGRNQLTQGLLVAQDRLGGMTPAESMVMVLLESRTVAEEVAEHFDLMSLFETNTLQGAVGRLQEDITEIGYEEGVILITVEAEDPNLAADLANFYIESLESMNQSMNLTAAKRNRVFIEERLVAATKELKKTEDKIKDFQLENMAVFLEDQVAGAMREAVALQGQITATEVEIQVQGSYLKPEHPDLLRLRLKLEQLQERLRLVERGTGEKGHLPGDRLYPAWINVPALSVELGHHQRELETHEQVYKFLMAQLEEAKIAEVKGDPTVQLLDPALPPSEPSKPRVKYIMLFSGLLALFVGVMLSFFMDYVRRMSVRQEVPILS